MRPEERIEYETIQLVWFHLGIKGSKIKTPGDTSYPDRLFWLPGGKPLLIEFKVPGGDPEPKQDHIHDWLRELGYEVQVHDNAIDAFQATIDAVAASCISKESRQILARARLRCAVLRSRSRED